MTRRLIAYVGGYADDAGEGGISAFAVTADGGTLTPIARLPRPEQAGFLAYRAATRSLYAVDERKTDGRGPVGPAAALHAFRVGVDGGLQALNSRPALGAFPTYLAVHEPSDQLFSVSHGSFEHVEQVISDGAGGWHTEFVYDDSTVIATALNADGSLGRVVDAVVLDGHGTDPNASPQAAGHAQAGPHAHCAVVDPSGTRLLVADKGTDRVLVFAIEPALRLLSVYQAPPETGPRHLVFASGSDRCFATFEFSSEVAAFDFHRETGMLTLLRTVRSFGTDPGRVNEPADLQVHPDGRVLYANNRGEDTLAWFGIDEDGGLAWQGATTLAPSVHPGAAARAFTIDPDGRFLLVADRPAGLLRSYTIAPDGALTAQATAEVHGAAFVLLVDLMDGACA